MLFRPVDGDPIGDAGLCLEGQVASRTRFERDHRGQIVDRVTGVGREQHRVQFTAGFEVDPSGSRSRPHEPHRGAAGVAPMVRLPRLLRRPPVPHFGEGLLAYQPPRVAEFVVGGWRGSFDFELDLPLRDRIGHSISIDCDLVRAARDRFEGDLAPGDAVRAEAVAVARDRGQPIDRAPGVDPEVGGDLAAAGPHRDDFRGRRLPAEPDRVMSAGGWVGIRLAGLGGRPDVGARRVERQCSAEGLSVREIVVRRGCGGARRHGKRKQRQGRHGKSHTPEKHPAHDRLKGTAVPADARDLTFPSR